jgi:SP family arabinose:H+ symporter-like MFS transporter
MVTTLKIQPGPPLTLFLSTAVASIGGLLFGFDTAVIAGTTHSLTVNFRLTTVALGITVSCALWGTVAGCAFAGFPAERLGGRESMRIVGVLYLISALGCSLSDQWLTFLSFRFIGGIAIGGCSVFAPMYIAETSPAEMRGKLVGCFQLSIVTGILAAYASNYAIGCIHLGAREWRVQIGVAAIPSLLFIVALGLIPRSPRWLMKQGRFAEAESVLDRLGFNDVAHRARRIEASLSEGPKGTQNIWSPAFRKPLLIALALGFFNQFTGINAVLYYVNDIFAHAGFGSISASEQAVAVGIANLLFTIAGMTLIDRVGRRPLLLVGSVGMSLTLLGVAMVFYTNARQNLLLPLLVIFIAFFAASQGAVVWVYLSEIFPNSVREAGQSFASLWLWLLTALVAGVFPSIAARSSGLPFVIFCAANIVQFFVVLCAFPETRGRSLESTELLLARGNDRATT